MATYIRLTDYKSSDEKEQEFFNPENRYEAEQKDFSKIPASRISYWVSDAVVKILDTSAKFNDIGNPRRCLATGNDDLYIRYWYEVEKNHSNYNSKTQKEASESNKRWFPFQKGGDYRKWFGNNEFVVNWFQNGVEIKTNQKNATLRNLEYSFDDSLTWSYMAQKSLTIRYSGYGNIFSGIGGGIFSQKESLTYLISFLMSKVTNYIYNSIFGVTLTYESGNINKLPIVFPKTEEIKEQIKTLSKQNIDISKEEWDSRETSWDFTKNELIKHKSDTKIETTYTNYCNYWREQLNTLHQNEEELNRLFIDIYELQDELTPDVELKDITILKNETKIVEDELVFQSDEIMKQFISYGVGVMFGRYSLDSDGLLIANMGQEVPCSLAFEIDDDNVIPVLEDDYFKDDIASRYVQFVKATFGEEDLSENIRFIESSLGTTLRKYFVKGFYEDHIKRYKKRPIYWMVASPKKGFMSLIYMHRYQADTFARVRNSYLTEYIAKLEAHKETLTLTTSSDTASDRDKKDADKQMKNIDTKLKEIIEFDRDKMMSWSQNPTEIDLDDGVKVNYCKFKDILYPITGLCK